MKLVIITRPDFFDGETALVNRLFRLGMERLHLRKPKSTEPEMAAWLDDIDAEFLPRIVLHDHHGLAFRYQLGGIHLNGRNPVAPAWAVAGDFSVSRSCHSLDEVVQNKPLCNYVFLSPIYDSISKEGCGAAFQRDVIDEARQQGIIDHKVFALGGINGARLPEVRDMGFGGAAILGDLWQAPSPEQKFKQIAQLV